MKSLTSAGLVASLVLIAPGVATATTVPNPLAPDGAVDSTTLNVFGTGITLDVTLNPDGHLAGVSLVEPVDPTPGHEVRIVLGDDGTDVEIRADGNKVDTRVHTTELPNLVGEHSWSGELFGDGGGVTTVRFTVADVDGFPEISNPSIETGADATPRIWTETDEDGYEAKLRYDLVKGSDTARVLVTVSVDLDDDRGPSAKLKIGVRSNLLVIESPIETAEDRDAADPEPAGDDERDSNDDGDRDDDRDDGDDSHGDSNAGDDDDGDDGNHDDGGRNGGEDKRDEGEDREDDDQNHSSQNESGQHDDQDAKRGRDDH